jgi:hypothetical protein
MKPFDEEVRDLGREMAALSERLRSRIDEITLVEFGDPAKDEIKRLRREIENDRAMSERLQRRRDEIIKKLADVRRLMDDAQRTVFTLSTSALALTVTFKSSFVPAEPQSLDFLRFAWIALTGATVAFPLGVFFEAMRQIELSPRRAIRFLSTSVPPVGVGLFLTGIIFFLLFALRNLHAV